MDQEFERRWRHRLPPFDGVTLSPPDLLPLPALRPGLSAIVEVLQRRWPNTRLFTLHDWHEHDGYVTVAQPSSWEVLRGFLASDEALATCSAGDTYVSVGFFPEDRGFYLRIYVPHDSDNPYYAADDPHLLPFVTYDVTCGGAVAAAVVQAIEMAGESAVERDPAAEYFDRGYSG
jgi:hypothetical protein